MSNNVVSVSPIPAHFLLRRPIEQAVIAIPALVFAAPGLLMGAMVLVVDNITYRGIEFFICLLIAAICGRVGWWLGTLVANVVCLMRHRRAQREGGPQ